MEDLTITEFHKDVMNLVAKYIHDTENVTISFEQICKILTETQLSILTNSKSKNDN